MRIRNTRRRHGERGAQSLEWIGLGTFVVTAMAAATAYATDHVGGELGGALVKSITSVVSSQK